MAFFNLGIDPSLTFQASICCFTSFNYTQSFSSDNKAVVEKIKDMLIEPKDRTKGLELLRMALKQNPEIHSKGNWIVILSDILKDSGPHILKELACDIFCMLISPSKDAAAAYEAFNKNFSSDLFPFLLREIDKNVEWTIAALKCVYKFMKVSPLLLAAYKDDIFRVILRKISSCVSSEVIEIIASCFAEMPNIARVVNPELYMNNWRSQYLAVLNTLQKQLNPIITYISKDSMNDKDFQFDGGFFFFDDGDERNEDIVNAYLKGAYRYINLSKCLSKMLCSRSRFLVSFPLKGTLNSISQVFEVEELSHIKPTSPESQVICSILSQMQVASLLVLESLILNCDLISFSPIIAQLFQSALVVSKLPNISTCTIWQIRLCVWKVMKVFIKKHGCKVTGDFISFYETLFKELLEDICIEDKNILEANVKETAAKSSKDTASSGNNILNEEIRKVCKEALQTLEQIVHTGYPFLGDQGFKDIYSKIFQIANKCCTRDSYPFPYDDGSIRKDLYAVLLALAVISNLEQSELANYAYILLKKAHHDPSCEVTGFCNTAISMLNVKMNPKRPPIRFFGSEKQKSPKVSASIKCPEWTSEEYVPNISLEDASSSKNTHDNVPVMQTFHGPSTSSMHEEDMELDPYNEHYTSECYATKYSEQAVENPQNGNDIQSLQTSTSCQGEVDSDEEEDEDDEEEEEDEDDEEEDERNYEEDERNYEDEEVQPENIYIPTTSCKLQILTPVRSTETVPQSVAEQEYEQLRPCAKTDIVVDSIKNKHLNGEHNIVPDRDVPSSSTQPSLANENGILLYDDDDDEKEEVIDDDDDDEEEEEDDTNSIEKRIPIFYPSNIPFKRAKLDRVEPASEPENEDSERDENELELLKKEFIFTADKIDGSSVSSS